MLNAKFKILLHVCSLHPSSFTLAFSVWQHAENSLCRNTSFHSAHSASKDSLCRKCKASVSNRSVAFMWGTFKRRHILDTFFFHSCVQQDEFKLEWCEGLKKPNYLDRINLVLLFLPSIFFRKQRKQSFTQCASLSKPQQILIFNGSLGER